VVTALKFFQPAYESDPLLLQYAMRVLEQHPVSVTFFYTPQVVQALRTDELGKVPLQRWPHRKGLHLKKPFRIYRAIHFRDRQHLAAFLSSDYLEHEGQSLQGRQRSRGLLHSNLLTLFWFG
jgi:hypothetical protein